MKQLSILLILFLLMLISCKSKTAFDYSEQIVKMETDLAADIAIADEKVSRFLDTQQNDSAIIISQQMKELTEKTLAEVKMLEAPKVEEGENFKKAAIRYFTYLTTLYTSFNKLTMAATDEAKEAERLKLSRIVDDKEDATKALQVAQQKFAAANNFRIEKVGEKASVE